MPAFLFHFISFIRPKCWNGFINFIYSESSVSCMWHGIAARSNQLHSYSVCSVFVCRTPTTLDLLSILLKVQPRDGGSEHWWNKKTILCNQLSSFASQRKARAEVWEKWTSRRAYSTNNRSSPAPHIWKLYLWYLESISVIFQISYMRYQTDLDHDQI